METTSSQTNLYQEYFFKKMLESAEKTLVIAPLGEQRTHPRSSGKDSFIVRFGNIEEDETPDELAEGVTPSETQIKTNRYTVPLKQYGKHITITDWLDKISMFDVNKNFADRLGYDAGLAYDKICRNELVTNATTSVQYASTATSNNTLTATMTMTAQDAIKGVRVLRGSDAPTFSDGLYVWVVHNLQGMDIAADTSAGGFIELNKYVVGLADKPLKAEIGKVYGARVVESNNISKTANATPINVYNSLLLAKDAFTVTKFGRDAIEMIAHAPGSAGSADPLNQKGSLGYKIECGVKYTGGNFSGANGASPDTCIQIRSAATGG